MPPHLAPADLAEKASKYTQDVAVIGAAVGALAAAYYVATTWGAPAAVQLTDEARAAVDKEEALQRK